MLNPLPPPTTLGLPGKVASAGRTSTTSIISISNPTATNAPAVAASAPKWLVLTIFFPFCSPRAGRSDLPRCRSLCRFCFWERIATPRPCEGPSPPRRPLLGDLYAHEVHRTVERIVERVYRFGSHHDVGRVGLSTCAAGPLWLHRDTACCGRYRSSGWGSALASCSAHEVSPRSRWRWAWAGGERIRPWARLWDLPPPCGLCGCGPPWRALCPGPRACSTPSLCTP